MEWTEEHFFQLALAHHGTRHPAGSEFAQKERRSTGLLAQSGRVFGRDDPAPGTPGHPDLATAVEASSAIPGYFQPVEIDGTIVTYATLHNAADIARAGDDLEHARRKARLLGQLRNLQPCARSAVHGDQP